MSVEYIIRQLMYESTYLWGLDRTEAMKTAIEQTANDIAMLCNKTQDNINPPAFFMNR